MKKIFVMSAMAAVMFAGCVKNEPAPMTAGDQVISFAAPVMTPNTKAATEIADAFPTTGTFAVWAYYQNPTYTVNSAATLYMNQIDMAFNESKSTWTPSGGRAYYWPKNGSLTFAAYSPYVESTKGDYTYTAAGLQIAKYTVPAEAVNQADLLFSERSYNQTVADMDTETATDPYTGVTINFKHALSSIVFKVKEKAAYELGDPAHILTVTGITLTDVNTTGSFNQGLVDGPTARTAEAEAVPCWTMASPAVLGDYEAFSGTQDLTITACYLASAAGQKDKRLENTTDLILLPQLIPDGAKLVIDYTLNNGTANLKQQTIIPLKGINDLNQWYRGKRYTYTITIALDEITFEPKVNAWADAGDFAEEI
jgi:hypothetical protein